MLRPLLLQHGVLMVPWWAWLALGVFVACGVVWALAFRSTD